MIELYRRILIRLLRMLPPADKGLIVMFHPDTDQALVPLDNRAPKPPKENP